MLVATIREWLPLITPDRVSRTCIVGTNEKQVIAQGQVVLNGARTRCPLANCRVMSAGRLKRLKVQLAPAELDGRLEGHDVEVERPEVVSRQAGIAAVKADGRSAAEMATTLPCQLGWLDQLVPSYGGTSAPTPFQL